MSGRGRDFAEGVSSSGDWWWVLVLVIFFVGMFANEKYQDWKVEKGKDK